MARRRRKNHGRAVLAGDLARSAVASIVPEDLRRLVRVQAAWDAVTPPGLRRVACPAAVRDRTVIVHAVDHQWVHELVYLRSDLLARLRQVLPEERLDELRTVVGRVTPLPAAAAPDPATPRWAEPDADTIASIHEVEDAELRQVIADARLALSRPR